MNEEALAAQAAQRVVVGNGTAYTPAANGHNGIAAGAADMPEPAVAPAGSLTIQPESIVQVGVEEDPTLDGSYQVNASSAIEFGYVGLVFLDNLTADQAAEKIRRTLESRGFKAATVTLRIAKASYDKVRVSGAVMKPSDLKIGPGAQISVEEALRRSEGLRPQAKGVKIKIVRRGMLSPFGVADVGEEYALVGADGQPEVPQVYVGNTDWIYVYSGDSESRSALGEKEILVLGEVDRPGVVRFSGGEPCTMLNLVLKMGGLPKWADSGDIRVIRKDSSGNETELRLDIRKLIEEGSPDEDTALENGDRVIISERTLLF